MQKIVFKSVFNRRRVLNKRGVALIQIEAYLNKKRKYFSTNIYIQPNQWDNNRGIIINHPNKKLLNQMIDNLIADYESIELKLRNQRKDITLKSLKQIILESSSFSFCDFYKKEVTSSSLRENTKNNHLSTLKLLELYKENIHIEDIDYDFIYSFESFLMKKKLHLNTIAKHMKHLKKYINIAIDKGYYTAFNSPFKNYQIKTLESSHRYLTPEELGILENLSLDHRPLEWKKSLDAFLFCCYTGLRYSDFVSLNNKNIVSFNNEKWLIYRSVKTNVEVRIPIYLIFEGKSLNILSKYKDNINSFFLLKDNSTVNKYLISIRKIADMKTHFSFHTARHTNATLLIYRGANITTVQKLLGHKNIKTTQIYSNVMDMTIVQDLKSLR